MQDLQAETKALLRMLWVTARKQKAGHLHLLAEDQNCTIWPGLQTLGIVCLSVNK